MEYQEFFARKADAVARDLVGRFLTRTMEERNYSGQILEVGAYESGRETSQRRGMKYAPGTIFLMPYRGFKMLNIATDREGFPSCVEIRRLRLQDEVLKGSAKISNYLELKNMDGVMLGNGLDVSGERVDLSQIEEIRGATGTSDNCIGTYSLRKQ